MNGEPLTAHHDDALAHSGPVLPKAVPNYANSDDAEADRRAVKRLQDMVEALDLALLHHGLSPAAFGFEAPACIEWARTELDEVRRVLNGAMKSATEARDWVRSNEDEEREATTRDPAWSARNSV